MLRQAIVTVAVAGVIAFGGIIGSAPGADAAKVSLCHATGDQQAPYLQKKVSNRSAKKHLKKHAEDYISPNGDPCTAPVDCVVTGDNGQSTQTARTVVGTGGDDTIDCTNAFPAKTVTGGAGNDTITGTAFNDSLNGGDGNDTMSGGPGNDSIIGGRGNDTQTGGPGTDTFDDTGEGEDTITQ